MSVVQPDPSKGCILRIRERLVNKETFRNLDGIFWFIYRLTAAVTNHADHMQEPRYGVFDYELQFFELADAIATTNTNR